MSKLKFIDLFAGLGGFHLALNKLGHKCVFSSELCEDLQKLYKINFKDSNIHGDITKIDLTQIPAHDILCAGFPCQPFSQAGKQEGFNDSKSRGNLFNYIIDILQIHHPTYVFLENVANLEGHDGGNTWKIIESSLRNEGYDVKKSIISPHEFGKPQHRRRIYIVCKLGENSLLNFNFPEGHSENKCNIKSIINEKDKNITPIKNETLNQLQVWQEFIDKTIEHGEEIPRFPIWAMEFGATYEYEKLAPYYQTKTKLLGKKGKLGKTISGSTKKECLEQLPVYAQNKPKPKTNDNSKTKVIQRTFPDWKIKYISKNREFYRRNKSWLDIWLKKIELFHNSHMKLEWNCGPKVKPCIEDKIVQFRASGIRIKNTTYSPALNLVGTQIPIFPWIKIPKGVENKEKIAKGRYMTLKEAALIQGMGKLSFGNKTFKLPLGRSYEALGNAVNVDVVYNIAKELLKDEE